MVGTLPMDLIRQAATLDPRFAQTSIARAYGGPSWSPPATATASATETSAAPSSGAQMTGLLLLLGLGAMLLLRRR